MLRRCPIIALACCMAPVAFANSQVQQLRRPATVGNGAEVVDAQLSLTRTIALTAVSMAEVLGGTIGASPASGGRAASAVAGTSISLGAWSSARPAGSPQGFSAARVVRRSVQDAWQLRVESALRRQQYFDVAYQLRGANGRAGHLSHAGDRGSEIGVRLEPIAPTVVITDGDYDVLQGGVTFYLELAGVRRAGRYQGTLTVTFNNF